MSRPPTLPAAAGGGTAPTPTVPCSCPNDFVLNPPCRIVRVGGGRLQISATELPGMPAGTYNWTTASTKIRLAGANSSTVTVEGLAQPSARRDAETITVTRTANGCPTITKRVNVTVAKVTFSAASGQRYGYDDYDTPANTLDDHVCIKSADYSFLHVAIEGGAVGTDFNFVCDDPAICTPVAPGGQAAFDLRLNAAAHNKAETALHAKCRCTTPDSFTHIQVHVYAEKLVEVIVAKIVDNTVPATALHRPTMDASAHAAAVNGKTKEAVVRYTIANYDAHNGVTNVRFDLDGNGALSYDINANGGAEVSAIAAAMVAGVGRKVRIAIIKKLKSYYYLSSAVAAGATTLTVRGSRLFNYTAFPNVQLGLGADQESVTVTRTSGTTITLSSGVRRPHAVGTPIEYIAGGWASDPIVITEEHAVNGSLLDLQNILWSIPHEAGHRVLLLDDIEDRADLMNYQQGGTDHRLRYCPRRKHQDPGTQNQWETIPRQVSP